jgi:hypothetical protein
VNVIAMRSIDTKGFPTVSAPPSLGKPARLEWLAIKALIIDPEYQREVSERGRKNIVKIAGEFDWSKFAPVIVAPAGSDKYAIVDGQHRATAAALCGLDRVPCCIIDGTRAAQAAAFAAINAVITTLSTMQIHAAKVAAGDPDAVRLNEVCARAGVTICRYPIPAKKMVAGQTLAAAQLQRFLTRFGDATLEIALSCITRAGNGNSGWVRAPIIEALCAVLSAEPDWRDSRHLLSAMTKFDYADAFNRATSGVGASRSRIVTSLIEIVAEHLESSFKPFNKASVAAAQPTIKPKPTTSCASKPTSSVRPPAPVAVAKPAKAVAPAEHIAVTHNAVTIVMTAGSEAITYRGKSKTVSPRQAKLFELLARGMPNAIGRDFLRQKLFNVGNSAQHDVQLDLVAGEAKISARMLGLDVRETRGIGFSLVKP